MGAWRSPVRTIPVVNMVMIGAVTCLYALVTEPTPLAAIIAIGLALGFFNSLQFTSINSLAYADVEPPESSTAATIASSFPADLKDLRSRHRVALIGAAPQSDPHAVVDALHDAYLSLGVLTVISSLSFWTLRATDGASISRAQTELV